MTLIDPNVARVKVIDELGKIVWRKPDELNQQTKLCFILRQVFPSQ